MREAEDSEVPHVIDSAVALAISADPETIADWRRPLAHEPTVSNERADG